MRDRLTKRWGDKVKIPVSPMVINDIEDIKEYLKAQKEIRNMIGVG